MVKSTEIWEFTALSINQSFCEVYEEKTMNGDLSWIQNARLWGLTSFKMCQGIIKASEEEGSHDQIYISDVPVAVFPGDHLSLLLSINTNVNG